MTTDDTSTRELSELLALGTYQGMTDAEIELVIDFKVQQRVTDSINLADIENRSNALNELVAQELENQRSLSAMVQSLMSRTVFLERVEGNNG